MNGVWKFVAVSLIAVFVAVAAPSIGWFVDSRDQPTRAEMEQLQATQNEILTRLAVIEEQIRVLQEALRAHENGVK